MSKIIRAPIGYVYDWATDYTEEDNSIWGGKYSKIILLKTSRKAVYAYYDENLGRNPTLGIRVVTFHPSKCSWHLDYYGENNTETGEYRLLNLGKNKTRLEIILQSRWKHGKSPSSRDFQKHANYVWDRYVTALERDCSSGKPAKS